MPRKDNWLRPVSKSNYKYMGEKSLNDDFNSVFDFIKSFDLAKVAKTFRSIEQSLDKADPAEKFMLLVETCKVIGLL